MNEDIIYRVYEFLKKKDNDIFDNDRPVQKPFSRWTIEEIIYDLRTDCTRYPDEIIRGYITNMELYEEAAERERKDLYRTARKTAQELYSYLFEQEE